MIVGRLWIDEIRDPAYGARMVGLVDLDLFSAPVKQQTGR
jgi:hypothetical protein